MTSSLKNVKCGQRRASQCQGYLFLVRPVKTLLDMPEGGVSLGHRASGSGRGDVCLFGPGQQGVQHLAVQVGLELRHSRLELTHPEGKQWRVNTCVL